jgi:predicted AAA+ superfamily ATPase
LATETALLKHLYSRYYPQNVRFSYWRGKRDHEVDLITEVGGQTIPFEIKYRSQHTGVRELKGLLELCQQKSIERGYVATKSVSDFGEMTERPDKQKSSSNETTRIVHIPAPLLCYWMGESDQDVGERL